MFFSIYSIKKTLSTIGGTHSFVCLYSTCECFGGEGNLSHPRPRLQANPSAATAASFFLSLITGFRGELRPWVPLPCPGPAFFPPNPLLCSPWRRGGGEAEFAVEIESNRVLHARETLNCCVAFLKKRCFSHALGCAVN